MKTAIIIPACYKSTRLPGKLLLDLAGKTVLQHTWERACEVSGVEAVIVAADSIEIVEAVESWGGVAYLTDSDLSSGTLRIHAILELVDADLIINLQGDEPFAEPTLIEALIERARSTQCDVVTAVHQIKDIDDLFDRNVVKVLRSNQGKAIYFSRTACPAVRDHERLDWLKYHTYWAHIGIYGYTRKALEWYAQQSPSSLESIESLEQLRFIDHGWHFQTVEGNSASISIDTQHDLNAARLRLEIPDATGSSSGLVQNKHYLEARKVFYREIDALETVIVRNKNIMPRVVELILQSKGKVVVTGLGKSGIIAHKISATLSSTGTTAVYLNAAEALHGDLGVVDPGDIVIMLSNSAKTAELLSMLPSLRSIGVEVIGLYGKTDTNLAKSMSFVLDAGVTREACPLNLAPMSSTTNALVLGDALAGALMSAKGVNSEDFALFHPGGALGRRLLYKVGDVVPSKPDVPKIRPELTLKEVINEICSSRFGAACVVDPEERLIGIITDGDLRRYLSDSNDLTIAAGRIMNVAPQSVTTGTSLSQCLQLMEAQEIYVIPVIDEDTQQVISMIRMHDVLG